MPHARGVEDVDPRLRAAMIEQLARRREALSAGAEHVGWKLGLGDRESVDGSIAVGYLTSATRLEPDATYRVEGLAADLRADAEMAVTLGENVDPGGGEDRARQAIGTWATALEIVDVSPVLHDAEAVIAANVFHRAVAFGPARPALPAGALRATLSVNGEQGGAAEADTALAGRLADAARVLAAVGERLRRGDRIITGLIVQLAVAPGDRIEAEIGALGAVRLQIAP